MEINKIYLKSNYQDINNPVNIFDLSDYQLLI